MEDVKRSTEVDEVKLVAPGTHPSPYGEPEPKRFKLPNDRTGRTVKFTLTEDGDLDENGIPTVVMIDGYFTINTYSDGMPGEIWITVNNPGYAIQGFANCWAISMSMLLQFGVHPQKLYSKFKAREFQPSGISQVASVPLAKSMVDLIMRWMELNMAPTARPTTPEDESWMKSVEEVVS